MEIRSMRFLLMLILLVLLTGCATTRTVTISTKPEDAVVKVNGVVVREQGSTPVSHQLVFGSAAEPYRITASRTGYKESTVQLTREDRQTSVLIELQPLTRQIHFDVRPAPAILRINGQQVTPEPVSVLSRVLEFTVDAKNNWTSYTVTAERPGFQPARVNVTWLDSSPYYTLTLEPMRKDLNINSEPPGATVYLDGDLIGTTPLFDPQRAFTANLETNELEPRLIRLEKPGYDPVEMEIGWDDGRSQYAANLGVKQKLVRITTDPPDAQVQLEGVEPQRRGATTSYNLAFPPINEAGELRIYRGRAVVPPGEREWYPAEFEIAYDDGTRTDYHIELREILTRPVLQTIAAMQRGEAGWECVPKQVETLAMKQTAEPDGRRPVLLARAPAGTSIGSIVVAPNGSRILFSALSGSERASFRSQLLAVHTDGNGSIDTVTDGRTLDITPSFTPGGDQILFSSNRAGRARLQIWSISAIGEPGVTRLTTTESSDMWPALDSDPKPRLFYQAMVDVRDDPRIVMTPLGTVFQTDISVLGGTQPRISPKNDTVLFSAVNEETGKRDVYRMSDRGGQPQNLTNSPDSDDSDAVWSRDGTKIAFTSDRGEDEEGRRNYDIWILDLSRPNETPTRVTANGSVDDNPQFDPQGNSLYFRSNRGGEWGIWKVSLR
jgi:hypothetical protein